MKFIPSLAGLWAALPLMGCLEGGGPIATEQRLIAAAEIIGPYADGQYNIDNYDKVYTGNFLTLSLRRYKKVLTIAEPRRCLFVYTWDPGTSYQQHVEVDFNKLNLNAAGTRLAGPGYVVVIPGEGEAYKLFMASSPSPEVKDYVALPGLSPPYIDAYLQRLRSFQGTTCSGKS